MQQHWVTKGRNAQFGRGMVRKGGPSGPSLSLSASTIAENLAQGVTIATASPVNASNPGAITLSNIVPAGALQMNVDGVTIESGPTSVNFDDATGSVTFTASYTDDFGVHNFGRSFTITDVADGPTITGAASTLATLLGTPTVNSLTTFDMRNAWVSPTGQTLTFVPSYGTIAGDGFTLNWTPTAQEFSDANGEAAFSVTATDEDSQSAIDVAYVTMATVNTAPTAVNQTIEFLVPEGAAPALASSVPADNATDIAITADPTVTFDRDILLAATGTVTVYDVTGAAALEVFDLATEVGSGAGQIEKTAADTFTLHMTADFANSNAYAIQWSAGAITNLGGIGVAALSDTTTLNFTTIAGGASLNYSSIAPTTDALIEGPFTLTFDDTVAVFGTAGEFYLKNGGTTIETFDVDAGTGDAGGTVALVGATVVITPGVPLTAFNTVHNVQWNANAVKSSGGNSLAANSSTSLCTFTTEATPAARTLNGSTYMHRNAGSLVMGSGVANNYYVGLYWKGNLTANAAYKTVWGLFDSVTANNPIGAGHTDLEGIEILLRHATSGGHVAIADNRSWSGAHEFFITVDTLAGVVRYYVDGVDESAGATITTQTSYPLNLTCTKLTFGIQGDLTEPYLGTIEKAALWLPQTAGLFNELIPTTSGGRADMANPTKFRTLAGGAQAAVFGSAATLNALKNRGTAGAFDTKVGTFT